MWRWGKLRCTWGSGKFFPVQVPHQALLPKHNGQNVFLKSSQGTIWTAMGRSSIQAHTPSHAVRICFSKISCVWSDQLSTFATLACGRPCSGFPHSYSRGHLPAWLLCPKSHWGFPLCTLRRPHVSQELVPVSDLSTFLPARLLFLAVNWILWPKRNYL